MRKVMMTGAGSFIGRHLVSYLKNHGYWARGVDVIHEEALLELIACLSLFLVVLFFRFGSGGRETERFVYRAIMMGALLSGLSAHR
jgi:nucleoside-diphosphate-sugar epimerase